MIGEEVFAELVESLDSSLELVRPLKNRRDRPVLLVKSGGKLAVMKVGFGTTEYCGAIVQEELRRLKAAQGIEGIPRLHSQYVNQGMTAFARQYFEGDKVDVSDAESKIRLVNLVSELHSRDICCLDLHPHNFTTSQSRLGFVDLGPPVHMVYREPGKFSGFKKLDHEALFMMFQGERLSSMRYLMV